MRDSIERFLVVKRAENVSPNTIRAYRADLNDLAQFVGYQQGPEQLTRTIVRAFLATLGRREASKTTITRKLYALKSFSRWLFDTKIIAEDVCDGILGLKGPKLPNNLPDVPSQEEMKILLDGGDFPTAFPERDRLICELLYGSGLRVSEAAKITLDDLRPEQNAILIHGKGGMYGKAGRQRLVPLNPHSKKALDEYLAARSRVLVERKLETRALFFSRSNSSDGAPIDVRSVARMLVQMTRLRRLQRMHPHLLRHACATHMLDNRCPLDVIAEVLGHDNLDITAHYAQVSTRLMMDSYKAAHPHARG